MSEIAKKAMKTLSAINVLNCFVCKCKQPIFRFNCKRTKNRADPLAKALLGRAKESRAHPSITNYAGIPSHHNISFHPISSLFSLLNIM